MQLSKSDYMLFLKHPAWLWLKKNDKDKLPPVDDNTQAIFDAGNMFEAYAEKLFPDGIRLGFNNYQEYISLPSATKKAIDDGNKTIFQGRFEFEDLTFICDIINFVDDGELDLYEIKSTTSAKIEHEFDLAFQLVVLEGLGYKVRNISVIHVNSDYVRQGKVDSKKLVAITDISKKVKAKREPTKRHIKEAIGVASLAKMPDISPSHAKLGTFNEWLKIYRILTSPEPYSIYDLCAPGVKRIAELESRGIKTLAEITDDIELTDKQKLQVEATKLDKEIIDKDQIKKFLSTLKFPLYFLDYETLSSIVPYFDGIKPYQQIPFQYSLHVLDSPDSELKHFEYLHDEDTNPVMALSKSLESNIGTEGTVLTWNMSFEKNCNTAMANLAPEYTHFYDLLNERINDLMLPFAKGWYVNKEFKGSASIKAVLPVLVPDLSYKALGIQEGSAAQRMWLEAVLDGKRPGEKAQILKDLLEYCKLDTLAMVEIYNTLKGVK